MVECEWRRVPEIRLRIVELVSNFSESFLFDLVYQVLVFYLKKCNDKLKVLG